MTGADDPRERLLLGCDPRPIAPDDPAVTRRLEQRRQQGLDLGPPTWAYRVWRWWLTFDSDGRPATVSVEWQLEFGRGGDPYRPPRQRRRRS